MSVEQVKDLIEGASHVSVEDRPSESEIDITELPDAAESVDGNALAMDVHAFLGRFIAYPSEAAHVAHTLWTMHTHPIEAFESTPRLAFLSPEPGSGKTRALEITELLVPMPVAAVNVTPAYLFRKVGDPAGLPTILYDEIDTVFGEKAKDNEEIRGLLNAGHRRGAVAGRCVVRGQAVVTEEIPAFCAVALAGLRGLPDTIMTRSIVIRMRKRAPGEYVEPYRRRVHAAEGFKLRDRLVAWATGCQTRLSDAWPELPEGVEDRDADVWEPLLAIADEIGGDWPGRARVSAVTLVTHSKESALNLNVQLLTDLYTIFGDRVVMGTDEVLNALINLDESPWGDLNRGQPLNSRGLAQRLRQFEVKSQTVRLAGGTTAKGYRREHLADAWSRYLPPSRGESVTSVTSVTDGTEPAQEGDEIEWTR